ncbi:MAG: LytR/AlgR family response regulator transcription factor [Flavobacteriales bacterium]
MDPRMTCIIIDDEAFARENLKMFVDDFCPELEVLGLAASANDGLELIDQHQPDVVFLDVMMPGGDGFSLLNKVEDRAFDVIFTTAHDEFALKAIKQEAVDYLEKPINIEELQQAVGKAVKRRVSAPDAESGPVGNTKELIERIALGSGMEKTVIPTRDGMAIVDNRDIIHLEASESYTTIFLTEGRKFLSSKTIKIYEDKLNPQMFFRTHKSHIINITHHLREFQRTSGNYAILSNGVEVPISRRKLQQFLDRVATL